MSGVREARWGHMFQHAADYYGEHGDLLVPIATTEADGCRSGLWVRAQRAWYAHLPQPAARDAAQRGRFEQLESIGMAWHVGRGGRPDMRSANLDQRIRDLVGDGARSLRQIAAALGISRQAVHHRIAEMPDAQALRAQLERSKPARRSSTSPPKPPEQFEIFGERKTLHAWARDPRCTVAYDVLLRRMRAGTWDLQAAMTAPLDKGAGRRAAVAATIRAGERRRERIRELVAAGAPSARAIGRQLDITASSVGYHIRLMPDAAQLQAQMDANRRRRRPVLEAFGEHKMISEWARDPRCAVSPNTFRRRLAEGWRPEDAITTPGWLPNPAAPIQAKENQS